ncbi:MAG: DUF1835 domain-containing protein [Thalassobaculum sp.]|uniref:DUF1835 domain-containing protein n=1 Tax=Thalassobaculum sp. TaxID=2022740 RepID=UPI0032EEC3DA
MPVLAPSSPPSGPAAPEPVTDPDEPRPLDLDEQRRRARELQRAVAFGEPAALARLRTGHPRAVGVTGDALADILGHVDDAQLVIARELGLPSWPALVAHAGRLAEARRALTNGDAAPDGDRSTLHLRCGSDIRDALQLAGFAGDFLEFSDPLCQGPVPGTGDLRAARARFVSETYGLPADDVKRRQDAEAEGLTEAAGRYERVVLWFEHDSYDQLILARVLAHFAEHGRPVALELICLDRFPQIDRFIGLGQLSPVELRSLWSTRVPVPDTQLALGTEVWAALRAPDPETLHAIASAGTPELPAMAPALRRHLQELPWTTDGLSQTERLVLAALRPEPATGGRVFRTLHDETEPLPFLGDLMLWAVLAAMNRAERPPFAVDPATALEPWPHRRLVLTYDGHDVLDRRVDWLACRPPERWVGGVAIRPDADPWRWCPDREAPVQP